MDVSKTIFSGDWELVSRDGKVKLQDYIHPTIVLDDADAVHLWQVLNKWVERNAPNVEVDE